MTRVWTTYGVGNSESMDATAFINTHPAVSTITDVALRMRAQRIKSHAPAHPGTAILSDHHSGRGLSSSKALKEICVGPRFAFATGARVRNPTRLPGGVLSWFVTSKRAQA